MSNYDDLIESVLEERDVPQQVGAPGTLPPPASRSSNTGSETRSGEVPINETRDGPAASPDIERSEESAPRRGGGGEQTRRSPGVGTRSEPGQNRAPSPATSQQPARRGMARQRERSGRCPMYAPAGTVCKTCGKVHPL